MTMLFAESFFQLLKRELVMRKIYRKEKKPDRVFSTIETCFVILSGFTVTMTICSANNDSTVRHKGWESPENDVDSWAFAVLE